MNIDVPDVEMDEVYEEGEREEFPPGEFEAEEDGPAPVNSSDDEGGEPAEKKIKSKSAAKKVVKNPQVKLDDMRLCGQRGIPLLPKTFRDVEFKGKGHEVEDLDLYLSKMEHWAHRMFPKMNFDEVIDRCDRLYKTKKLVKTTLIRMRNSDNLLDDDVDDRDDVAREGGGDVGEDEFDDDAPPADVDILSSTRPLSNDGAPPTTATPPPPPAPMSEEIRDKIERNKRLALEKRMARLQAMREQEVADAQAPPAVGETQTPSSAAPTTEMPISSSSSSSSPAAASVTTTPASSSGPLHSMPAVVSKTMPAVVSKTAPPTSIPIRKEGTNTSAEMASTTEISSNAQPNSKTVETTESRSEEEPGQSGVSSTPSTAAPTAAASAPTTLSAPTAPGSASTAPGSMDATSPRNEPEPEPELDEDELLKLINE